MFLQATKEDSCKSTTPVFSVDSAVDSWDSSGQDLNALSQGHCSAVPKPRPSSVSVQKSRDSRQRRPRPYSSDSTDTGDDFGKKLSELQISDEAWEGDHESSRSEDSSPDGADDWSKAFKKFKAQAEVIEQSPSPEKQHSTGSLDRRALQTNSGKKERQKVRRNWSHSTSRGAISQNDLRPYVVDRRQRRCASSASARDLDHVPLKDQLKTVYSPQPIQLHRVTLVKDSPADDFGFGVSDGVYDKGVYISAIRPGSVAEGLGLKQYDRILQVSLYPGLSIYFHFNTIATVKISIRS